MRIYPIIKNNLSFNAQYKFDPYLLYKPEQVEVQAEPNEELNPIDIDLLRSYGMKFDKIDRHQPLEAVAKRGKVKGMLVDRDFRNAKQPYIALLDRNCLDEKREDSSNINDFDSISQNPPQGIILVSDNYSVYKHDFQILASKVGAIGFINDVKKFSDLIGKNVIFDTSKSRINMYESVGEDVEIYKQNKNYVKVPVLEKSDHVLSYDEITSKNSGAKAYNQKRLREFLNNNGYSDITVPDFVVIPWNMVNEIRSSDEKLFEYLDNWEAKLPEPLDELTRDMDKNKIATVIARSDFNCEDLPDFSAPGNYVSTALWSCLPHNIVEGILCVADSKNTDFARNIRQEAGIKDEEVQPSVIIQKLIRPNYFFTMYTKDDDGKLRIELIDDVNKNSNGEIYGFQDNKYCPYRISFDRNTEELNLETIGAAPREVTLDDNYNLVELGESKDYISNNWEEFGKIIKYLSQAGVDIEKHFGHPQDIEGGIKDGKIYLWQTRNICAE
ncbi:hypothetical protein IKP85_00095 [bacterium]|nr:hypothetical protein [bacterium]